MKILLKLFFLPQCDDNVMNELSKYQELEARITELEKQNTILRTQLLQRNSKVNEKGA